jgi:hypothetical protein
LGGAIGLGQGNCIVFKGEFVIDRLFGRDCGVLWVRRALPAIVTIALAGLMAACSSVQTYFDFDPAADYKSFKTYTWKDVAPINNARVDAAIVKAVDKALADKRLTKVEAGGDLTVTYHAAVDKSMDVQTFGYTGGVTYGYGGWYGGSYYGYNTATTTVREVKTGMLAIDLIQASSNNLVYRGVAAAEIGPTGALLHTDLDNIVYQIFKTYPPK